MPLLVNIIKNWEANRNSILFRKTNFTITLEEESNEQYYCYNDINNRLTLRKVPLGKRARVWVESMQFADQTQTQTQS